MREGVARAGGPSSALVFGPKNVPQPITLAVPAGQKGPLTSSQVMFILPFTASRVTVPTHCFTSWKERLEVKLEPPGHNLPGSAQGLKISLKPLVQQLGKHSPVAPAPRLTPVSLKSHCSVGCRLVLGHTVSFTLKLTGFRAPWSSAWSTIKVGRLGSAHVSFSHLSP